jgi:hypothetical protein
MSAETETAIGESGKSECWCCGRITAEEALVRLGITLRSACAPEFLPAAGFQELTSTRRGWNRTPQQA